MCRGNIDEKYLNHIWKDVLEAPVVQEGQLVLFCQSLVSLVNLASQVVPVDPTLILLWVPK